ncbi:hypothetical protein V8F20_011321 [Naviculisporaceae sp. PSN 640]
MNGNTIHFAFTKHSLSEMSGHQRSPHSDTTIFRLAKKDLDTVAAYFTTVNPDYTRALRAPSAGTALTVLEKAMHLGRVKSIHIIHSSLPKEHPRSHLYFEFREKLKLDRVYHGWTLHYEPCCTGYASSGSVPRLLPVIPDTDIDPNDWIASLSAVGHEALFNNALVRAKFPVSWDVYTSQAPIPFGLMIATLWGRNNAPGVGAEGNMLSLFIASHHSPCCEPDGMLAIANRVSLTSEEFVAGNSVTEAEKWVGKSKHRHFCEIAAILPIFPTSSREKIKLDVCEITKRPWNTMSPQHNPILTDQIEFGTIRKGVFRIESFQAGPGICYLPYDKRYLAWYQQRSLSAADGQQSGATTIPEPIFGHLTPRSYPLLTPHGNFSTPVKRMTFSVDQVVDAILGKPKRNAQANLPVQTSMQVLQFLAMALPEEVSCVSTGYIQTSSKEVSSFDEAVVYVTLKNVIQRSEFTATERIDRYYQTCFLRINTQTSQFQIDFQGESLTEMGGTVFLVPAKHHWMTAAFEFSPGKKSGFQLAALLARLLGNSLPAAECFRSVWEDCKPLNNITGFQVSPSMPWDTRDAVCQWFIRLYQGGFVGWFCTETEDNIGKKFMGLPFDVIIGQVIRGQGKKDVQDVLLQRGTFFYAPNSRITQVKTYESGGEEQIRVIPYRNDELASSQSQCYGKPQGTNQLPGSYPWGSNSLQPQFPTQPISRSTGVAALAQQQPSTTYQASNQLQGSYFPTQPQQSHATYSQQAFITSSQGQQGQKSIPGGSRGGHMHVQGDPAAKRPRPPVGPSYNNSGQGRQYSYEGGTSRGGASNQGGSSSQRHSSSGGSASTSKKGKERERPSHRKR